MKDERDGVGVEDHGEPPRGASPLSPGAPANVRHSSATAPSLSHWLTSMTECLQTPTLGQYQGHHGTTLDDENTISK